MLIVYSQPRSTAVPDAVSTKNNFGGAEMIAAISPRASAIRCSPGRAVTTRTLVFGDNSTEPIAPTLTVAREFESVSIQSPAPILLFPRSRATSHLTPGGLAMRQYAMAPRANRTVAANAQRHYCATGFGRGICC